jgi:hypothetical protein
MTHIIIIIYFNCNNFYCTFHCKGIGWQLGLLYPFPAIVLYCTVLYCTVLYCTVLYCTREFKLRVIRQTANARQRNIIWYQAIKSKWTCCFKTAMHNYFFDTRKKIWNENVQRKFCQESSNLPFAVAVPGNVKLKLPNILYCTVLYCTVLYCTVLYCTVLYCTVLYCTVLYCTVLYCTVLYCTVLYCTVCIYLVIMWQTIKLN